MPPLQARQATGVEEGSTANSAATTASPVVHICTHTQQFWLISHAQNRLVLHVTNDRHIRGDGGRRNVTNSVARVAEALQ